MNRRKFLGGAAAAAASPSAALATALEVGPIEAAFREYHRHDRQLCRSAKETDEDITGDEVGWMFQPIDAVEEVEPTSEREVLALILIANERMGFPGEMDLLADFAEAALGITGTYARIEG